MSLIVRQLDASDEADWRVLWRGYLDYYETSLGDDIYATTFARLTDPDIPEIAGLLAVDGNTPCGLVHYLFHRHTWRPEGICYLQDLFVAPEIRGRGVARALIEAVYAAADSQSVPSVYWTTQEFNYRGRMLYDKVGTRTPFIKYQR